MPHHRASNPLLVGVAAILLYFFSFVAVSGLASMAPKKDTIVVHDGQTNNIMQATTAATAKPMPSFYQRKLPDTCVAFSSKVGKKIFASALAHNGLKSFFPLIQQFTTQTEPAFCGLSTLVLVLNALAVDPQQHWKGPWRWYEETMLNCCLDLEEVKQTGITLKDFTCLAHCQGLSVDLHYAGGDDDATSTTSLEDFRAAVQRACVEEEEEEANDDDDDDDDKETMGGGDPMEVMIISYSRKVMGQTGSGHFSPLAAYDAASDSVLILDTARFKYGAHWAKLPLVYDAMKPIDPDTGKGRGYALLSFVPPKITPESSLQPVSLVFRSKMSQHPARRLYKEYLSSLDNSEITWGQVVEYWTKDGADCIWQIVEPLRLPQHAEEEEAVLKLRKLVRTLLLAQGETLIPPGCCVNHSHKTCVSSLDALYIVYLASLQEERRASIVRHDGKLEAPNHLAKQQILNEAALIASAIETSDQTTV